MANGLDAQIISFDFVRRRKETLKRDLAVRVYAHDPIGIGGDVPMVFKVPSVFRDASRTVYVSAYLDYWSFGPHRFVKVRDMRGDLYVLRQDMRTGAWAAH